MIPIGNNQSFQIDTLQQQLDDQRSNTHYITYCTKQKKLYHSHHQILLSSTLLNNNKKEKDNILCTAVIILQAFCRMIRAKRQAKILVHKYYIKIIESSAFNMCAYVSDEYFLLEI